MMVNGMKRFIMAAIAALFCVNADAGTISWQLDPDSHYHDIEFFKDEQEKIQKSNPNPENKMLFIMLDMSYDNEDHSMINDFMRLGLVMWGDPEPAFPPSVLNPDCIMGTWEADINTMSLGDVYETGEIADGEYNIVIIAVWLDSKNMLAGYGAEGWGLTGPLQGYDGNWYDYYGCTESYHILATTGTITDKVEFSKDRPGNCTLDMITANVPEPATGLLALAGIALLARRKRK